MSQDTTEPLVEQKWTIALVMRFSLNVALPLVFAVAGYVAWSWDNLRAAVLPLVVCGLGLVLGVANLALDWRRMRTAGYLLVHIDRGDAEKQAETSAEETAAAENADLRAGLRYFAWIGAYCLAMWVVGARLASALFLFVFFRWESKLSWTFAVLGAIGAILGLLVAEELLQLRMPRSLLGW